MKPTCRSSFFGFHRSSESRKATYLPVDALMPVLRAAATPRLDWGKNLIMRDLRSCDASTVIRTMEELRAA